MAGLYIHAEDSTAERAQIGKAVKVGQYGVEALKAAPRETGHGAVFAVGLGAECLVHHRNQVGQEYLIERRAIGVAHGIGIFSALGREGSLHVATLHDHNHRYTLATGNQVVKDVVHPSLMAPARLVLTHTVLKVEHWVAFALVGLVFRRRIDHSAAEPPLRSGKVGAGAHLSLGHALLRAVIVALIVLRYVKTAHLSVAAEIGVCGWVGHRHAIHDKGVVMEALHQRSRHSVPLAVGVTEHGIFLSADVHLHIAGLGSTQAEEGAALGVNAWKVVAGNGILGQATLPGFGVHLLRNAQQLEHHVSITLAEDTVALGGEVQAIAALRTVLRRDNVSRRDGLSNVVNDGIVCAADSALVGLHHLTHQQGHVSRLQAEVGKEVFIDGLHARRPGGVCRVRLSLMEEDTLHHALLHRLPCGSNQTGVGVAVITAGNMLHPVGLRLQIVAVETLVEEVDAGSANGSHHHAHPDVFRKEVHHTATEIVGRGQSCCRSHQGRHSRAPLEFLPSGLLITAHVHRHKARTHTNAVAGFGSGIALHIRLSEAEINLEIGVYTLRRSCCACGCRTNVQRHRQQGSG